MAAASIYQAMYGQENPNEPGQMSIPATFQIVYFIGKEARERANDRFTLHRYFHRYRSIARVIDDYHRQLHRVSVDKIFGSLILDWPPDWSLGWKPDKSQAKPAARGSANVSLKDLDQVLTPDKMDKLASDMLKDLQKSLDDKDKPDGRKWWKHPLILFILLWKCSHHFITTIVLQNEIRYLKKILPPSQPWHPTLRNVPSKRSNRHSSDSCCWRWRNKA